MPDRIASIVYIDAVIPNNGDTVFDQIPARAKEGAVRSDLNELARAPYPSDLWVTSPEDRAWVDAKATPQPLACLHQPIRLTGDYLNVNRRVYVYAVGFAEDGHYQQFEGHPGCIVRPIADTRHDIMIDQPERLANVLMEAAL
jgi:hypothetical protein